MEDTNIYSHYVRTWPSDLFVLRRRVLWNVEVLLSVSTEDRIRCGGREVELAIANNVTPGQRVLKVTLFVKLAARQRLFLKTIKIILKYCQYYIEPAGRMGRIIYCIFLFLEL